MPKFPLTQIFADGKVSMGSFNAKFFTLIAYTTVIFYTKCILITIELTVLSKEETP